MLLVLDLGIGQRGLLDHRPQDRPRAAIEAAVHRELGDLARDPGFGPIVHRRVGVVPVADHTEALELFRLDANPVVREVTAFLAELDNRHIVLVAAVGAVVLLDLPLDRQAVAVPAGHVVRIAPHHLLGAADHVLQDLVQRMADVQVAVRVGRAVMQDERFAPRRFGALAREKVHLRPARKQFRFLLRKAGAHRKIRLRQEDRVLVVDGHVLFPDDRAAYRSARTPRQPPVAPCFTYPRR